MLGILGLGVVLAAGFYWYRLIQAVAVPDQRVPHLAAFAAGGLIGVLGIVQSTGWIGSVTGGLAAVVGFGFVGLRLMSGQPANKPAVEVGGPMLAFTAPDEHGTDFDASSLNGKPYLLKFFRGHW